MRDPLSSPVPKIFLYLNFFYLCIRVKALDALTYMGVREQLGETVHSYSVGSQELDSGRQLSGKHLLVEPPCWLHTVILSEID